MDQEQNLLLLCCLLDGSSRINARIRSWVNTVRLDPHFTRRWFCINSSIYGARWVWSSNRIGAQIWGSWSVSGRNRKGCRTVGSRRHVYRTIARRFWIRQLLTTTSRSWRDREVAVLVLNKELLKISVEESQGDRVVSEISFHLWRRNVQIVAKQNKPYTDLYGFLMDWCN